MLYNFGATLQCCSLLIAVQHWVALVQIGDQEVFKGCWDSHIAVNGCVPACPNLCPSPVLSQHGARKKKKQTGQNYLRSRASPQGHHGQTTCFSSLPMTTWLFQFHISKKNRNWEQNNMGLPWLSEWLSMCSLSAPRWRKAQSLYFVDGVLLSERLNSTSWLSKTQFTVFRICLL